MGAAVEGPPGNVSPTQPVADDGADAANHPVALAARRLLIVTHGKVGRGLRDVVADAAPFAYQAAYNGALGNHESADEGREDLCQQLSETESALAPLEPELRALWNALVACHCEDVQGSTSNALLDVEAIEDLVLGHICAYPDFLEGSLVKGLVQHVALGQGLLDESDRRVDMHEFLRHFKPCVPNHSKIVARISSECCDHLMRRSETIASKLLLTLDSDGDGKINLVEFLRGLPHGLALEIENVAVSVGVKSLLADPDFSDDFHTAMAAAMGITGEE